jgi:hypothetical protein
LSSFNTFVCSASLFALAVVSCYHVFLSTNKHLLTLKPGHSYTPTEIAALQQTHCEIPAELLAHISFASIILPHELFSFLAEH